MSRRGGFTEAQRRVLRALCECHAACHRPPSVRELGRAMGREHTEVFRMLRRLARDGYVWHQRGESDWCPTGQGWTWYDENPGE